MNRFFEVLPGTLSWLTLIAMVVVSWLFPVAAAVFIILFDVYWLLKTIFLSLHLRGSFRAMRRNLKIDWLQKLGEAHFSWQKMRHLIIFPMYNEPHALVRESFAALTKANYPLGKFLVVLAIEARAGQDAKNTAEKIRGEFGDRFGAFLITEHPANLPNEIPGKGSNETWAGRQVKEKIIDSRNIPYEDVLVSVFDVDTQVLPEYFGILTHTFFSCPHPQASSYQPVPLFTNNIYQAPALGRVIAFSATFWHLTQQSRPERLTTFSSHSMPFKALVEVGFWNTNIVSEDSQIFWQCLIHFDGNWETVPVFYPVSMDANVAPTFWQTMKNLYKQQRRWAWGGAENIPYMLKGFRKNKRIPFRTKFYWAFNYIEGFHSWATNSLIIFSLGWLPIMLGDTVFKSSLLSYNLPRITRTLMTIAMFGIISSSVLSIILLPPKPTWFKRRHYFLYAVQWILTPLTLIVFGAFPALEAQTRAILGGKTRLGFWVTPKQR